MERREQAVIAAEAELRETRTDIEQRAAELTEWRVKLETTATQVQQRWAAIDGRERAIERRATELATQERDVTTRRTELDTHQAGFDTRVSALARWIGAYVRSARRPINGVVPDDGADEVSDNAITAVRTENTCAAELV